MKKVKSNNELFVSYVNGILEIQVDYKVVYSKYHPFTDEGIWVDAAAFDKKIRREVKNLMAKDEEAPKSEDKVEEVVEVETKNEEIKGPEVIIHEKEKPTVVKDEEVDALDKEDDKKDKEVDDFFESIYTPKKSNTKYKPTTKTPNKDG